MRISQSFCSLRSSEYRCVRMLGGTMRVRPTSFYLRFPLCFCLTVVPFAPSARAGGRTYSAMVRRLQEDMPDLLSFFAFPRHLWRKLRTTNVIERCFVEVRRRIRPMVCFVNVESVDRIIYSIFQRFNLEWKTRTLNLFTQAA